MTGPESPLLPEGGETKPGLPSLDELPDWQRQMVDACRSGGSMVIQRPQRYFKHLAFLIAVAERRATGEHFHVATREGWRGVNCPPDCPKLPPFTEDLEARNVQP